MFVCVFEFGSETSAVLLHEWIVFGWIKSHRCEGKERKMAKERGRGETRRGTRRGRERRDKERRREDGEGEGRGEGERGETRRGER